MKWISIFSVLFVFFMGLTVAHSMPLDITTSAQNTEIVVAEGFDGISAIASHPVYISFDNGATWQQLEEDEENPGHSKLWLTNQTAFSFRFKSDDSEVVFQFVSVAPKNPYFAGGVDFGIGYTRDEAFFQSLGIIKREAWGADESLRFETAPAASVSPLPDSSTEPSWKDVQCSQWQSIAPEDFTTSASQWNELGKPLIWPHRYSLEMKKIILHHTAENGEKLKNRTEEESMRAIYAYHAKNRKWGDIGYHFVIAPSGKIFEGKAGGDFIIGGHAYCANAQTIGIALMGNFENENPSIEQLKALEKLLEGLSLKYGIDIAASSVFHGKNTPNLVGHKDYGKTACPGKFLYALLPSIRNKTVNYESLVPVSQKEVLKAKWSDANSIRQMAKVGSFATNTIWITNAGNTSWKKNEITLHMKRQGKSAEFTMNELEVPPNGKASFTVSSLEPITGNQNYTLTLKKNKKNIRGGKGKWKISPLHTPMSSVTDTSPIRILLGLDAERVHLSGESLKTVVNGQEILAGVGIELSQDGNNILINQKFSTPVVRVWNEHSGIITIDSWERRPSWNPLLNDNTFRGILEIRVINGKLKVINELPLEDYLKGLAEVSDSAPPEKQKAMAVIARSYAKFYMQSENRKYPSMPYDGDDSPESFQKYLGYGYEQRSPRFAAAVDATRNTVVTFQGKLVKTPYFSESDGRTRSAKEVWGWENTPYLKAVDDTACKKGTGVLQGHGVGLSGCGAESMAQDGMTYEEILKYYYTGIDLQTY